MRTFLRSEQLSMLYSRVRNSTELHNHVSLFYSYSFFFNIWQRIESFDNVYIYIQFMIHISDVAKYRYRVGKYHPILVVSVSAENGPVPAGPYILNILMFI